MAEPKIMEWTPSVFGPLVHVVYSGATQTACGQPIEDARIYWHVYYRRCKKCERILDGNPSSGSEETDE